uniref:Uncharacterized protein n=1 Tax=Panagrolaimus davidi TaxID=227884 RepID=A0A914PC04_9BILA
MFKPTTMIVDCDGLRVTLKVSGYKIVLSLIYDDLIRFSRNILKHIEIIAKSELILDRNIHFPGTNLVIIANKVVITHSIECNLSGKNAVNEMKKKAANGEKLGENGSNGEDGIAGESSGNFSLIVNEADGLNNFKLILNGGNGSCGHDGGNGADGENGIGENFDDVFNMKHTHLTRLKSAGHILTLGSDGKPGGKRGENGVGGDGGKKGKYFVYIDGKEERINFAIKDGTKGDDGLPGKHGKNGYEGWDIAISNKTWGPRQEFGKSKKVKLELKECDSKDEGAICVKDKGNQRYVKIVPLPLKRSPLVNYGKQTNENVKLEKSNQANAVEAEALDIESLTQLSQQILSSAKMKEEHEAVAEENVIRLLEQLTYEDDEEEYVPKKQQCTMLCQIEKMSSNYFIYTV